MAIRILNREDVGKLISIDEVIGLMRDVFREVAGKRVVLPERTTVGLNGGVDSVLFMPACIPSVGGVGAKVVSVFPRNVQKGLPTISAQIVLNDAETGAVVALMDGTLITSLRTAAVSALATDILALKSAALLGIFGAGVQARSHIQAIAQVRDLKHTTIMSLDRDASTRLARECEKSDPSGCRFTVVDEPEAVVANSDIIVTATTSATPVFDGSLIREGTHINAIGSFKPTVREVDDLTVTRSRIFVDMRAAALQEAGDLLIPLGKRLIRESDIVAELGELVVGEKEGRRSERDITLFKSVGLAVEDIIVARRVYEKALAMSVGTEIS